MRVIGTAGVECFKGSCDPWVLTHNCHNCPIRPMKVYQGNGNSFSDRQICQDNGFGVLISPGGCRAPHNFPYYAVDNGAFSAWVNEKEWNPDPFLNLLELSQKSTRPPDMVVVPDKVASGRESLDFSLNWIKQLPEIGTRYYLAVQDGMEISDIIPVIELFGGLFVGGTLEWKYETAPDWVELAHDHRKPCHIGRIGTWDRIVWASRIGADSIDSSSWAQNKSYHHLKNAKMQEVLT